MNDLHDAINQAFSRFDEGDLDGAEALYLACLNRLDGSKSGAYRSIMHGLGYVKCGLGEYDSARAIYEELAALARAGQDLFQESIALHQIGMVERLAGRYETALLRFDAEYAKLIAWRQTLDEPSAPQNEQQWNAHVSANAYEKGYVRLKAGNVVEAAKAMAQALEAAKWSGDSICLACAYRGQGEIELACGEFDRAARNLASSAAAFRSAGDERGALEAEQLAKSQQLK
ncbi:hypothetical protein CDO73_14430 [Saccharibacillus sp. O23]|uniref:tetratricopeptide repeat protein n=1 Tax=Saccharibacillus sp. O23 TaxID=2009338 RepID=UPI000B4E7FD1|nr:tetratricopeptide repeat protein [Saccharibacillus sp. O23]OWR29392.1 hypothetical protein CDO73_14430 [Saccharibacillus sp. O23]